MKYSNLIKTNHFEKQELRVFFTDIPPYYIAGPIKHITKKTPLLLKYFQTVMAITTHQTHYSMGHFNKVI